MKKIRLKTFFYILFLLVILITIVFGGIIVKRIISVNNYKRNYREISQSYSTWKDMLQAQQNFLIDYNDDIVFFQTEQNKYIKRSQLNYIYLNNFIDSIVKNSANVNMDFQNKFSGISDDLQKNEQIFEKLANKLFLRGSNTTGTIGDCFSFYNMSQTYTNDDKQRLYINGMYNKFLEYLHQPDNKHYQDFMNIFLQLNSYISTSIIISDSTTIDTSTFIENRINISEDFINGVNSFKRSFTKLVELDNIIFLNPNNNLYLQLKESTSKTDQDWFNIKTDIRDAFFDLMTKTQLFLLIFIIIIVSLLLTLLIYFPNNFVSRISEIREYLVNFTTGDFKTLELKNYNISEFYEASKDISTIAIALKSASSFAYEISKSNFDYDFKPMSNKDELGNALIVLRDNLIKTKEEEENRRKEDKVRQWVNEGIAKFADILRESAKDIAELSSKVIKELVSYINANQGGVFVINDDNKDKPVLDLVASYAYNKERKKRKTFLLGEGLIGTCAVEKATMYMTDIPEDYISISSGLGSSNPRSLIIVPLMFEEAVLGVIEMASFEELPKYKIDFVERIAESIASTISISKINERTAKLLEISKKEAEQRSLKEEELRQNLEELRATQDRAALHERELDNLFELVNKVAFIVELDLDGNIEKIPDRISEFFELQQSEIIGRHISEFDFNNNSELVKPEFWQDLLEGEEKEYIHKYVGLNKSLWIKDYIIPSYNLSGNVEKFVLVIFDITEQIELHEEMSEQTEDLKEKEKEIVEQVKELEKLKSKTDQLLLEIQGTMQGVDRTVLRAEYTPEGIFIDSNDYHQKVLGYRKSNMINKSILEFIKEQGREEFMKSWKIIAEGNPSTLTVKRENKDTGVDIWLINYYNPIFGVNNEVEKILYLAIDITKQKMEEERLNSLLNTNKAHMQTLINLMEVATDAVQLIKEGIFVDCNKANLDLFEFDSKEEFLNITLENLIPEMQPDGSKSIEKIQKMFQKAMEREIHKFEFIFKKKDGKEFESEVYISLFKRGNDFYTYALYQPK